MNIVVLVETVNFNLMTFFGLFRERFEGISAELPRRCFAVVVVDCFVSYAFPSSFDYNKSVKIDKI